MGGQHMLASLRAKEGLLHRRDPRCVCPFPFSSSSLRRRQLQQLLLLMGDLPSKKEGAMKSLDRRWLRGWEEEASMMAVPSREPLPLPSRERGVMLRRGVEGRDDVDGVDSVVVMMMMLVVVVMENGWERMDDRRRCRRRLPRLTLSNGWRRERRGRGSEWVGWASERVAWAKRQQLQRKELSLSKSNSFLGAK